MRYQRENTSKCKVLSLDHVNWILNVDFIFAPNICFSCTSTYSNESENRRLCCPLECDLSFRRSPCIPHYLNPTDPKIVLSYLISAQQYPLHPRPDVFSSDLVLSEPVKWICLISECDGPLTTEWFVAFLIPT